MKELKEIRDDQIRIIGEGGSKNPLPRSVWIIILSVLGIALIGVILLFVTRQKEEEIQELKAPEPALFEVHDVLCHDGMVLLAPRHRYAFKACDGADADCKRLACQRPFLSQ